MGREIEVSVVIPTLGGEILEKAIKALNRGTLVPSEIIICIPEAEAFRLDKLKFSNVRIVVSKIRGQVSQRALGFHEVKGIFVLQLDDDVLLKATALELLVYSLSIKGVKNVVGPSYYDRPDYKQSVHRYSDGILGWLSSLEASIICGAPWGLKRMGIISTVGTNYGVNPRYVKGELMQTEWLPGGCVLSYKEDLILDSFYPFTGKAYGEDAIHSILRNQQNITHWVLPQAKCSTEIIWNVRDLNILRTEVRVKAYIIKLLKKEVRLRHWIWVFLLFFKELIKKLSWRPGSWLEEKTRVLTIKE
jgi:glycosyltransferase involved in cell wall biosynthesis